MNVYSYHATSIAFTMSNRMLLVELVVLAVVYCIYAG